MHTSPTFHQTGVKDDPSDQEQNQNKQDKAALQAGQLLPFLHVHAKQDNLRISERDAKPDSQSEMQNQIMHFNS